MVGDKLQGKNKLQKRKGKSYLRSENLYVFGIAEKFLKAKG